MKKKTVKLELTDKDLYTITVREIETENTERGIEEVKNKRIYYKHTKDEVLNALRIIL